jgi:hypothetical protein
MKSSELAELLDDEVRIEIKANYGDIDFADFEIEIEGDHDFHDFWIRVLVTPDGKVLWIRHHEQEGWESTCLELPREMRYEDREEIEGWIEILAAEEILARAVEIDGAYLPR